jgi:hypothetical protein
MRHGSSEPDFNFRLLQSELQSYEVENQLHIIRRLTLIRDLLNYPSCQIDRAGLNDSNTYSPFALRRSNWLCGNFPLDVATSRSICHRLQGPGHKSQGETK